MDKPDNPPAFARSGYEVDRHEKSGMDTTPQDGMTLRDYFAAAALQGYLASYAIDGVRTPDTAKAAMMAYGYADAMLKERDK